MKLGSAHQGGTHPTRTTDPALMFPPGYRVTGRALIEGAPALAVGISREVWLGESPGGLPISLTAVRGEPSSDPGDRCQPRLPDDLLAPRHPHLVPAFSAWPFEGGWVIVASRPKATLWDRFRELQDEDEPGLGRSELLEYLSEVAKALDYLASLPAFLGHGNVRPSSLYLEGGSALLEQPVPAAWDGPALHCEQGFIYTAPGRATVDPRSRRASRALDDQFGLAAAYVHLRTGFPALEPYRLPSGVLNDPTAFDLALASLDRQLAQRPLRLPRSLGSDRRIVSRAMAPDPRARFRSCREFVEALRKGRTPRGSSRPSGKVRIKERQHALTRAGESFTSTLDVTGGSAERLGHSDSSEEIAAFWGVLPGDAPESQIHAATTSDAPSNGMAGASRRPGRRVSGMSLQRALGGLTVQADPPSAEVAAVATTTESSARPSGSDLGAAVMLVAGEATTQLSATSAGASRGGRDVGSRANAMARNEGDRLLAEGRYEGAIEAYTRALSQKPRDAASLHGRGLAYFATRQLDLAASDLDAALSRRPLDASARNNRGLVRLAAGDIEGALADFRQALEIDPRFALVHFNAGRALTLLGQQAEAIALYTKAMELDPAFTKAHRARAAARARLGDAAGALLDFDHAIQLRPDDGVAFRQRGLIRFTQGDLEGASSDFEASVRLLPKSGSCWYELARARLALNRYDDAIAAFDEALSLDPSMARAQRGRFEAEIRRSQEAACSVDRLGKNYAELAGAGGPVPEAQSR